MDHAPGAEESAPTNPFDDPSSTYLVLVNEKGQHSLWPAAIATPAGWRVAHHQDDRQACLDYVASNWSRLRPGEPR